MKSEITCKILFLNQVAGPLFRELAEDLSQRWYPSTLYTGHSHTDFSDNGQFLKIKKGPHYDRRNYYTRSRSWISYFFRALKLAWEQPTNTILFIVSNPPFLGLVGLFLNYFRGNRYVVLVYDIYPDLLVGLGRMKLGFFAKCWQVLNRVVYKNSSLLITIGQDMAHRLRGQMCCENNTKKKLMVIPNWADVNKIKPIKKNQNWFVQKYSLQNITTVLYSGNMGYTHNIESILEAGSILSSEADIKFLFIGEGAKKTKIIDFIIKKDLKNTRLLPFQPENVLPYSMTAGDIGIVPYQEGTEGCIVPSKIYYYMAAGLATLVISKQRTDLSTMIQDRECGIWVKSGNSDELAKAILALHQNPKVLQKFKLNARKAAEIYYSRKNSNLFAEALSTHIFAS